jgi:hypothetical protein
MWWRWCLKVILVNALPRPILRSLTFLSFSCLTSGKLTKCIGWVCRTSENC